MNTLFILLAQAEAAATTAAAPQTGAAEGAAPQAVPGMGGGIMGFLPFIVLIAVFIYLSWRGQKKEAKRQQDMLNSIRKDTQIMTTGGIIGTIAEVHDDRFVLTIAPNVRISISRNAIGKVMSQGATASDEASKK